MALDIRTSELKNPIDVAEYLFRRLHEVGIRGVHGIPGDYNLVFSSTELFSNPRADLYQVALDYVPKCGLNWVGNVNELNAGIRVAMLT